MNIAISSGVHGWGGDYTCAPVAAVVAAVVAVADVPAAVDVLAPTVP